MENSWENAPHFVLRKIVKFLKMGSPETVYFCYIFKLWSVLEKKSFMNKTGTFTCLTELNKNRNLHKIDDEKSIK